MSLTNILKSLLICNCRSSCCEDEREEHQHNINNKIDKDIKIKKSFFKIDFNNKKKNTPPNTPTITEI